MISKWLTTRVGAVGAATVLAVSALAGTAHAASAVIDSWTSQSGCDLASVNEFCLYYSPNHTGGVWRTTSTAVSTLSGNFPGSTHPIRNDAASADNGSGCHVGIWVSPAYMGDSNWLLNGDKGGNLTSGTPQLRNNEASIAVDDSTNCPGVGIG